ncbi:MAG: hypothetical protein JSU57_06585 [Candidatus Heimdallarchaeota archaeon]|nr:MAG: hypothetical protein JSU57_06585 [Candidatus Heimdallarchaeota archaeon]
MISLFLLITSLDLIFIGIVSSVDGFLLLLLILPWTVFIYLVLCFKGLRFSTNDHLEQLAGKLYWISQGVFQATVIAVINIILGVMIIPDSSLAQFDQAFGLFSSILVLVLLPFPSFLILGLKKDDQEQLYNLIFQEMVQRGEAPEFIELTSELLAKTERYTKEYTEQLEKVREYIYQYIQQNFEQISPFFVQKQPFRLNLESLAIFLTKKVTSVQIDL